MRGVAGGAGRFCAAAAERPRAPRRRQGRPTLAHHRSTPYLLLIVVGADYWLSRIGRASDSAPRAPRRSAAASRARPRASPRARASRSGSSIAPIGCPARSSNSATGTPSGRRSAFIMNSTATCAGPRCARPRPPRPFRPRSRTCCGLRVFARRSIAPSRRSVTLAVRTRAYRRGSRRSASSSSCGAQRPARSYADTS